VNTIDLPDEHATAAFASDIAAVAAPGDAILLRGGLGAGKTAFARAFLRAFCNAPDLEVPSPTFTLVQTYDEGRLPAAHFDLYRISAPEEVDELGLFETLETGIVLVEWPERADISPAQGFDITLDIAGAGRVARIDTTGTAGPRLKRTRALRAFLAANGNAAAIRRHVKGDASVRRYERVGAPPATSIVMDWPPVPHPPGSYGARAHWTHTVGPFITVAAALREAGLSTPRVLAEDAGRGLLLLEDFGSESVTVDGAPVRERYAAAVDVLAHLHGRPRPQNVAGAGQTRTLPAYDRKVMRFEHERFLDFFVRDDRSPVEADAMVARFDDIWRPLYDRLSAATPTWLLRDYHSPNLMWLGEREGIRRVGLLDFQDSLYGPAVYDVMSLLQDARTTVPAELETDLAARYLAARRGDVDAAAFREEFAILGAHRNLRLVALFTRLAGEGRGEYAAHLPRCRAYLDRDLSHPVLSALAQWYEAVRARAEVEAGHEH